MTSRPAADLDNFRAIADAIATLFFPHAEVVLHDLRTQKIDHIANNLSKRAVGDDAALEDLLENTPDERNIGPYEKLNWDGQKIRSVSTVLRDAEGTPIAVLCLNLNISLFETAKQALDLFLSSSKVKSRMLPCFTPSIRPWTAIPCGPIPTNTRAKDCCWPATDISTVPTPWAGPTVSARSTRSHRRER